MKPQFYRIAFGFLTAGALLTTPAAAQSGSPNPTPTKSKVSTKLLALDNDARATITRPGAAAAMAGPQTRGMISVSDGYVAVDAVSTAPDGSTLLADLEARGLQDGVVYGALVTGRMPTAGLASLEGLTSLRQIRPAIRPKRRVGSVTSQGDRALGADSARAVTGFSGAGTKVGILSDSYDALDGEAGGIASGDLPANGVEILDDIAVGEVDVIDGTDTTFFDPSDEGRAMAEIIHDVAPGADLAFHTAFRSIADFALGIEELAAAGCDVIVDDIGYLTAPFFSPGPVAQAVNNVAAQGVAYYSSAGNSGDGGPGFYEAPFLNSGTEFLAEGNDGGLGEAHDFGDGDIRQSVTIAPGAFLFLGLQWDDPFFSATGVRGAETDLDIYAAVGDSLIGFPGEDFNIGADPIELFFVSNDGDEPLTFDIVIVKADGPDPTRIKYLNFGDAPIEAEFDAPSPTIFGHPNAEGATAVGAAFYAETPAFDSSLSTALIEPFSSLGGTPIFFTEAGERLYHPQTFQKPEVVGPDGANTTFFPEFDAEDPEGDGFPNFFGTSASAPHIAGVAALITEATRGFLPPEILELLLVFTAEDMDDPATPGFDRGFDFRTGFGYVRADRAVGIFAGIAPQNELTSRTTPFDEDEIAALIAGEGTLGGPNDVAVFPNPSTGYVTLRAIDVDGQTDDEPVLVTLHDAVGREVFRQEYEWPLNTTEDFSALPKGLYVARVGQASKTLVLD